MRDLLLRRRNLLMKKQEELNIRSVCFEADGEQTVSITKVGSAPDITMQYSYDGVNWDAWDLSALQFGGSTKVYIRGIGNTRFGADASYYNKITFSTDAFVYVSGIVESLLDGENEVLTFSYSHSLRNLFHQQTALRSAENLRFEAQSTGNSNVNNVYALMFDGCTNLLYAPKVLPATTLAPNCYQYMFRNCTSLVNAPELPATALASNCYNNMFNGCTSLVNAPALPATTLAPNCYQYMFDGCTSLVNAPALPATTLASYCYGYMFRNCTNLLYAPKVLPATTLSSYCYQSMFSGCTNLVNAPELPATALKSYCYHNMFSGCTSLKTIRCRAKSTSTNSTYKWVFGVQTEGTFYGHSEFGWSSGANGIPTTWTFEELTN